MSVYSYILAVDDEPNIRQLVTLVLKRNGFRVKTAASGRECLELVEEEAPALVLLDLQMPGMHGREVIEQLRARPETSHTPIIIISGSAQISELANMDQVDAFVEKPFDLEHLVTVIKGIYPTREDLDTHYQVAES